MPDPVIGTNTNGTGVSGTGSQYGVLGVSTGAFAGVVGQSKTAAPGLYGLGSVGPGLMAISGLGVVADSIADGNVDNIATKFGAQYSDYAAIFIGNVVVTGQLTVSTTVTITEQLTANLVKITGQLTAANGVFGSSKSGTAGTFNGGVSVTGAITANDVILSGADCAEEFDLTLSTPIEPGCVVVFDDAGSLGTSDIPYNRRVAGIVSGAGAFRPGVILDRRVSDRPRAAIALIGKVYCKVDADHAPIEVGDMLTTSPTAGYAMKATDPARAFGAVIGKALAHHSNGRGLIPILVTLQ